VYGPCVQTANTRQPASQRSYRTPLEANAAASYFWHHLCISADTAFRNAAISPSLLAAASVKAIQQQSFCGAAASSTVATDKFSRCKSSRCNTRCSGSRQTQQQCGSPSLSWPASSSSDLALVPLIAIAQHSLLAAKSVV